MERSPSISRKKRPPRRRLPNPDGHSMHAQHHQVRAMKEHKHMPNYKDMMKNYQDRVASINFRNDMLQRQKNANYQNEHQRLRGILEHTVVRGVDHQRLQSRMHDLKKMLHEGIN